MDLVLDMKQNQVRFLWRSYPVKGSKSGEALLPNWKSKRLEDLTQEFPKPFRTYGMNHLSNLNGWWPYQVMTLQVIYELWKPFGGAYTVDTVPRTSKIREVPMGKTGLTLRDNSAIQHLLGCVGLVVQGTEVFFWSSVVVLLIPPEALSRMVAGLEEDSGWWIAGWSATAHDLFSDGDEPWGFKDSTSKKCWDSRWFLWYS